MKTSIPILGFSILLVVGLATAPAFAQNPPIVISTDSSSYEDGDMIMVTGSVRDLLSNHPVTMQVIAPNNNVVAIEQLSVGSDKSYSHEIVAGGPLWSSSGTYTIKVLYGSGDRTAETTFEFAGFAPEPPGMESIGVEGEDDAFVEYTSTSGSLIGITPDTENSILIVTVDMPEDDTLTLNIPRDVLDSKTDQCSGDDDAFFVLVDGEEADFSEESMDDSRAITLDLLAGSEEIMIIGTCVIPEFGTIALLVLAVAIVSIVAVTARSRLIVPRY